MKKIKLPNDLIKSTDYDKAKDRIIKEFECVNGKVIQHYVLGGEHELTMQEIIDCLNALATIDCDLQTAYAYIEGQKDKIADLEAKLEERTEQLKIALKDFNDIQEENDKLAQQLAEKEKEIERLTKSFANKNNEDLSTTINGVKFTTEQIIALQQVGYSAEYDKNQTAIAELEKLKEKALHFLVQNTEKLSGFYVDVEEIDHQIRVLKGDV